MVDISLIKLFPLYLTTLVVACDLELYADRVLWS
jgi:hypothetical protein